MEKTIAAIAEVVKIASEVVKTVNDAKPFAEQIASLFGGRHASQEQIDALLARANQLAGSLQAVDTQDKGAAA